MVMNMQSLFFSVLFQNPFFCSYNKGENTFHVQIMGSKDTYFIRYTPYILHTYIFVILD